MTTKGVTIACAALVGCAFLGGSAAWAGTEEEEDEPTSMEEEEEEAEPTSIEGRVAALEEKLGFEFGGMIYGYYSYNFNDPENDRSSFRSLDPDHNSFTFDLLQIQISKEAPGGVAFTAKLDFGKTASRIPSDWDGDGLLTNSEETNDFEVQDAYLTYAPEALGGLSIKAGKFSTLIGAEVIEAPLNMNYSRSFLFGFLPFTHTGILFTAPLGETVSATAGVVNGWDNVVDNNDGKTLLANVTVTPNDTMTFYLNGTYGPEKTDTEDGPRGLFDTVAAFNFDPVNVSLNFAIGSEGDAALDGGDATFLGFSGVIGLGLEDATGIPAGIYARGEVFDDQDGNRTGIEQTLTAFTLTGKYFLTENLTAWAEFRHDSSDEDVFTDEGLVTLEDGTTTPEVTDSQPTMLMALSYVF